METKKPKTINPDEVDPSVYYYDEVYDDMKDAEKSEIAEQKTSDRPRDRKSKYIDGLKETAEQRKTDKEIRKFKKYTRDRETAGEDIADEDVYITSSYKRKLKQIEELETEKKRQIESEKDNSMNFTKRNSSRVDLRKDKDKPNEPVVDQPKPSSSRYNEEHETDPNHRIDDGESPVDTKSSRRRLKTHEERRAYLREILAKRTVGTAYDDAVNRYIARKAQSQK